MRALNWAIGVFAISTAALGACLAYSRFMDRASPESKSLLFLIILIALAGVASSVVLLIVAGARRFR